MESVWKCFKGTERCWYAIKYDSSGEYLVSLGEDVVCIWSVETGQVGCSNVHFLPTLPD